MAVPAPETPLTALPTEPAQPLRMSYEEYLAWADEDIHAEWVNNEVIVIGLRNSRTGLPSPSCSVYWVNYRTVPSTTRLTVEPYDTTGIRCIQH